MASTIRAVSRAMRSPCSTIRCWIAPVRFLSRSSRCANVEEMCASTCSSWVRIISTPWSVGEFAISWTEFAESWIASRTRRPFSASSARASSRRAVRSASAWNRSSLAAMRLLMAWSREMKLRMRSCSSAVSAPDVRHISVAISRIRVAACSSIARRPSSSRSAIARSSAVVRCGGGGRTSGASGRRVNNPRRGPPGPSGEYVVSVSMLKPRDPGPARCVERSIGHVCGPNTHLGQKGWSRAFGPALLCRGVGSYLY